MLRSFCGQRILPLVLVFALLIPLLVFPASAYADYNDYITNITVDGNMDLVTITIPCDELTLSVFNSELESDDFAFDGTFEYDFVSGNTYFFDFAWFAGDFLSLEDFPDGTTITYELIQSVKESFFAPLDIIHYFGIDYYDSLGLFVGGFYADSLDSNFDSDTDFYYARCSTELDKSLGAVCCSFYSGVENFYVDVSQSLTVSATIKLTFSISSLYRQQQQTNKVNKILNAVEKKLEQNGQKLDDVIDKIEQNGDKLDDTNDKLDDANDKLDKLPGEVGDEIQGVIDNEKNEAEDSGNKFVDQILDALPDPSTEVLAALKGLTDATSYTGTDAVLPVPALVLPGIDGLFPETVIWEGAELDFGEYMEVVPPALLSLVRSLFTIAIVLFCVYELKGIISYCLTLRDNKGG